MPSRDGHGSRITAEERAVLAASATGLERPVLDLGDGRWTAPPPGAATELTVVAGGQPLGTAPLRWGGLPWDRDRFLGVVSDWFVESSIRAEARTITGRRVS